MTGFFSRKAKNREELLRNEARKFGEEKRFKVIGEKVLTHEAYEDLIQNLNEDNEFVKEITNQCGEEQDGTARCFLFKDESRNDEALAINGEGYDYARYAALINL